MSQGRPSNNVHYLEVTPKAAAKAKRDAGAVAVEINEPPTEPAGPPRLRDRHEGWMQVLYILCVVILPPIGVYLDQGCNMTLAINILLTILWYLPGLIHALYVILFA
ncbi:hypothetical protein Poli38472_006933 [Pythium oligandrum]|uniref:Plasma membrane proteolipid 3 n=1 Tax=Pythium oligandrum TaxID=41045 RepID=A0A8K1C9A8_PYTOL|nr:hypothetical protein Poli38472_006933 [Pythium oligandrum]|eukprot:TMW58788.1 hypothetical protein Poli38472_006933 [Pythium oligandrum]